MTDQAQHDGADALATLEDLETDDVPAEAFEVVDLSWPGSYRDEVMAAELADYVALYNRSIAARKAAHNQGDQQRAEQTAKQEAWARAAAAYIQYRFPAAKAIAHEIMEARAAQLRRNRAGSER